MDAMKSELEAVRATLARVLSLLFDPTDWNHTAHILGNSMLNVSTYTNGLGTPSMNRSEEWIIPCSNLTNYSIMALVMGDVIDFFKPKDGYTVCEMLLSRDKHLWR